MRSFRNVAALAATAFGFGVCVVMLQRAIGLTSPWLGLLLMFYFMGLARVGQPLYTLSLPNAIRGIRTWEGSKNVYRRLGVHGFGKLIRRTPLRHLNSTVYLARSRTDLRSLQRHAESAEAIHFWAMLLFAPYMAYVWLHGQQVIAAIFLLVQLPINVYPILHLRVLRARLEGLAARRPAKLARLAGSGDTGFEVGTASRR